MEVWKDIESYEGIYQISNYGRVKSLSRIITRSDNRSFKVKELILSINLVGKYKFNSVHLYNRDGSRKAYTVHRLVAQAFIQNTENKSDVNHIDGNRSNNHVSNLEWSTRQENMEHGFRTGLINNTGINHGNNVYTDEQIKEVKTLLKNTQMTQKAIAEVTGVKKGTVEAIAQGKQWNHIRV